MIICDKCKRQLDENNMYTANIKDIHGHLCRNCFIEYQREHDKLYEVLANSLYKWINTPKVK